MYIILLVMYKCFVFSFLFPLLKVVFLETFDMCLLWSCCQIFYVWIHIFMYIIRLVIYKCVLFVCVVFLETFDVCLLWSCCRIIYIWIHMFMYIILLVIYKCFSIYVYVYYTFSYIYRNLSSLPFLDGCLLRNIWYVFALVLLTNILYMYAYVYVYYTFCYR